MTRLSARFSAFKVVIFTLVFLSYFTRIIFVPYSSSYSVFGISVKNDIDLNIRPIS